MHPLSEAFNAFRDECVWCCVVFRTHQSLFDNGAETDAVLSKSAPRFFYDYSIMSQEYHVMLVGRITDPAKTMGKANCTIGFLIESLRATQELTDEIEGLATELQRYRSRIKDGRDKLVSHRDLSRVTQPITPNSWPLKEVEDFHTNLNRFCDAVAEQIGEEPNQFANIPTETFPLISDLRLAQSIRNQRG